MTPRSGFVLRLRLSPWVRAYPMYLNGTSTQPLHRGHFAVTRPVGASTLTMAFRMMTSSAVRRTRVTRQIGHRPRSGALWTADACTGIKYLLSIGIVKSNLGVDKYLKQEGFMSLRLGDIAPDFSAESTQGPIRFHDWVGDSWAILFSHPRDFTPVCTTELGYVARLKPEFDRRSVKAIGLSIDPVDAHAKWSEDIRATQGQAPNFPIVADPERKVANLYGMMHPAHDEVYTVRTVFVIDPKKKIRLMITYPQTTGRNFDEILRVIDSLQLTDAHRVATPVNWRQGEDVIIVPAVTDEEAKQKFPARLESPHSVPPPDKTTEPLASESRSDSERPRARKAREQAERRPGAIPGRSKGVRCEAARAPERGVLRVRRSEERSANEADGPFSSARRPPCAGAHTLRRGSNVSRRPSPKRLIPSTVTRIASPGNVASHHAVVM